MFYYCSFFFVFSLFYMFCAAEQSYFDSSCSRTGVRRVICHWSIVTLISLLFDDTARIRESEEMKNESKQSLLHHYT